MTLVSLYITSSSSPGRPDQSLAPADARPPDEAPATPIGIDEDDVPLRALQSRKWMETRQGKARPSPLPLSGGESASPSESSSHVFPTMTPFPFAPSPFTPLTNVEAGTSASSQAARQLPELDMADEEAFIGEGSGENEGLLERNQRSTSITAKGSTGGPRWCKKCDGWKPDRCHHCRFCRRCTLKSEFSGWRFDLPSSGSSLYLGWNVRWVSQLQAVHSLPHLWNPIGNLLRIRSWF